MSLVVLLILAVVWGVFLIPQVLRARADRGPADSIGSFRNQLSMIEQSLPGGVPARGGVASLAARRSHSQPAGFGVPLPIGAPIRARGVGYVAPTRSELQKRRRDVLLVLLAAVVTTLALTIVFRPAMVLNGIADVAFAGYVAMLVRARTIAAEREMKVRYLPGPMPAPMRMPGGATHVEPALRTAAR